MITKQRTLIIGPSGAGKTTILIKLHEDFNLTYHTIKDDVKKILKEKETRATTLSDDELKEAYKVFIKNLPTHTPQIIKIANDWPELFFDQIIEAFKPTRIVYVDAPLETCLARTLMIKCSPPEYRMKNHHRYNFEDYKKLAETHNIPILKIDGTADFLLEYQKVKEFLQSKFKRKSPL